MFRKSVKVAHFSNEVRMWLMNTLALGPGIGDVHYLCIQNGNYHLWLLQNGIDASKIHFTVTTGHDALTANRNDVLCVFPGLYASADLAWSKAHTHLIGLGGPITKSDSYYYNVLITSGLSGTSSVSTFELSGAWSQIHNIAFEQGQAANTALTALKMSAVGNYLKGCTMIGIMTSTQDVATASSLQIADGCAYTRFDDCLIGSSEWRIRTAIAGQIYFSSTGTSQPSDILFNNCRIRNSSVTATNPAVLLGASFCLDRLLEFRDCTFYNYQINLGTDG